MSLTASTKLGPKTKRKRSADWIVINAGKGGRFECLRCGAHYLPQYPVPVSIMSAVGKAFALDHGRCELPPEGLRCTHCGEPGHAADDCPTLRVSDPHEWLRGSDTGTSSKTIWRVMMGAKTVGDEHDSYPLDPSDFGRCHRLLKLFPQWKTRLSEMMAVPGWTSLVANWGELEQLYEEELPTGSGPKLYALMRRLEKSDHRGRR